MLLFIKMLPYTSILETSFKYISCYCLSTPLLLSLCHFCIQIHLMLLFIRKKNFQQFIIQNSNTSHVIVYLPLDNIIISLLLDSNTSHVIVYQDFNEMHRKKSLRFKYISCYCLSGKVLVFLHPFFIQIHLMLLFIHIRYCLDYLQIHIQIHLMLLFILFKPPF